MTMSVTEPPESDVRLKITIRPATATALIAEHDAERLGAEPLGELALGDEPRRPIDAPS